MVETYLQLMGLAVVAPAPSLAMAVLQLACLLAQAAQVAQEAQARRELVPVLVGVVCLALVDRVKLAAQAE
jgi:hypothetical protein